MTFKRLVVSAFAALALSGLFAAAADAEEESRLTVCVYNPVDEAYVQSHSNTVQEEREAWKEVEPNDCVSLLIPAAEMERVSHDIGQCWEAHDPEGTSKAVVEECVEAWKPTGPSQRASRHARKKRHRKVGLAHTSRPRR
jgi:hypothetical protein